MVESESFVTRQSELLHILGRIRDELNQPAWVALVDDDGLLMACVPENPSLGAERIAAMTAAGVLPARRVLGEVEGGELRFVSFAGSDGQLLIIAVDDKRYLSLGLAPQVSAQSTFGPLSQRVPDLLKALKKRYARS